MLGCLGQKLDSFLTHLGTLYALFLVCITHLPVPQAFPF